MANFRSAGAHSALTAALPRVDHQRPIHDQFCRCRTCKPPRIARGSEVRRRTWVAIAILLATSWMLAAFATLGGLA